MNSVWVMIIVMWTVELEPMEVYRQEFTDSLESPAWDQCRRLSELMVANPGMINLKETDVMTARCAPKESS